MLSQGPRTAWRALPACSRALNGGQAVRYLGPLRGQAQLRQWSTISIVPRLHRQSVFRVTWNNIPSTETSTFRNLTTTRTLNKELTTPKDNPVTQVSNPNLAEEISLEFKRTEKAEAAKEVDLSARLKDRSSETDKGETIRLLRLAGREWKTLSGTPTSSNDPSFPIPISLDLFLTCSGHIITLYFLRGSDVNSLLNRQNNRHRNRQDAHK